MSRALIVLNTDHDRELAASWSKQAKWGTRVEFKSSNRSLPQNDRLWACLTEIARQVEWYGTKLSPDDWKDVFTASLRRARVVPGIDAGTFVPLGMRTSDMTKEEFSDLLELINAFAAERGVVFKDPDEQSEIDAPPGETIRSTEDATMDAEPVTGQSPVGSASPESAQAAEPEAERPEVGQGGATDSASGVDEREMVNSGKPMNTDFLKAEMVKKVLDMAGDQSLSAQERLENLAAIRPAWVDQMPGHPTLVDQVFKTAAKVIKGELPKAKAQTYLETL